jgi:hypothetical protein
MMMMLVGVFIFGLINFHYVHGNQFNWVGNYVDPTYGGNLAVCVSLVDGVYYGQGMISLVGYLRGTIDSSNKWTGEYFMSGNEAVRGNFTLTLSADNTTYSGSYQQTGSNIIYSVNNANKLSSTTPSDLECLKVDDNMLTMTSSWSLTSALKETEYPWYIAVTDTSLTSSYTYLYADGTISPGTTNGVTFLNGQIVLDTWYESSNQEGIEIILAKNSTHTYNIWWAIPSLSYFDYSMVNTDYNGLALYAIITSISVDEIYAHAYDNVCYSLWTTSSEQSCLSTSTDDDDDDQLNHNLLATAVAFSVLTFVVVMVVLVFTFINRLDTSNKPMAAQAAPPTQL